MEIIINDVVKDVREGTFNVYFDKISSEWDTDTYEQNDRGRNLASIEVMTLLVNAAVPNSRNYRLAERVFSDVTFKKVNLIWSEYCVEALIDALVETDSSYFESYINWFRNIDESQVIRVSIYGLRN